VVLAESHLAQVLRVEVELTLITATVTDVTGRIVPNLTSRDFLLAEDGIPQAIAHLSFDQDSPVSYGILIDRSGSMSCSLETALQTADSVVQSLGRNDEAFLMTFAGVTKTLSDFTSDKNNLRQALRSREFHTVDSTTNLYSAMEQALAKIKASKHSKRALLIFSDGHDMNSSLPEWVKAVARNSGVPLYGIGVVGLPKNKKPIARTSRSPNEGPANVDVSRRTSYSLPAGTPVDASCKWELIVSPNFVVVANETGGRVFRIPIDVSSGELAGRTRATAKNISTEVAGQYSLGYYSQAPKDRLRAIHVRAVNPAYSVRTTKSALSSNPFVR